MQGAVLCYAPATSGGNLSTQRIARHGGGLVVAAHLAACLGLVSVFGLEAPAALAGVPERFDTIVIDPGHGGDDRGARGVRETVETDVVLAVGQALAKRLREVGA